MYARIALQLFCCFACVVAGSNVFQADFHRFEDLPSGTVGDANCNVETVETANDDQLNSILMELTNTTFFRLYKVDLSAKCIFWQKEKHSETSCGGETEEGEEVSENSKPISNFLKEKKKKPTLCSLTTGTGASLPWGPQSSPVKKLSRSSGVADKVVEGCKDSALPEFWLDLCPTTGVNTLDKVDYVDLQTNPERFTGYNGSKLWDAIYQENCFSRQRAAGREPAMGELCYEERVLYRLLSGMHSAINIHIALQYFPPRKGKRTEWAPNPQRFLDMFHEHPERLKNMHFAFVVLLRALRKAAPALETFPMAIGDEAEDRITKQLLQRLLESHILKSCGPLFSAFDESKLFKKGGGPAAIAELKQQFKGVFRNITSILDCVTCQKCTLHGKMQIMGLGTALTILLLPENLIKQALSREEVVAFVNTIAKFSDAISHVRDLSHLALVMDEEKSRSIMKTPNPSEADASSSQSYGVRSESGEVADDGNTAFDIVLDVVSKYAMTGRLSHEDEDLLVDGAVQKDRRLAMLIKHYAIDPERFVRHAVRTLSTQKSGGARGQTRQKPNAIVVGAGLAGLSAALTLIDRGANVVIVEKQGFMGGNSAYASSGINAAENTDSPDVQKDSSSAFAHDMVESSGISENDSEHPSKFLIPVLTSNSQKALEWAKTRVGVDLSKIGQLGGHSFPRTYRPSTGMAGSELIFAISKIIKTYVGKQVELRMKTVARELLVDESGNGVIGLKVQSKKTGEEEDIFADNVIIATGGFANDRTDTSLLKKFRPDVADLATTNGDFATGDGHKMIMGAGGGVVDMEHVQVHPTAFIDLKRPKAMRKTLCAELLRGVGGLLLNKHGKRFVNELGTRKYIVETMNAQPDHKDLHFTILLSPAMARIADKHVPHYAKKHLLRPFSSIAKVAEWMNVSASSLKGTIEAYNLAAKKGVDRFGKKFFKNAPFPQDQNDKEAANKEAFYAGIVTPALHYSMGGVSIDDGGKVLKSDGLPFSGLYAAGEVTGGVHGMNRLGGNALTECIVFGQVVGEGIVLNDAIPSPSIHAQNGSPESNQKTRKISAEELAKHNTDSDCWVAIGGKVYDLTDFLNEHPAGPDSILELAGKEGTEVFDAIHTHGLLDDFDPEGIF